MTATEDDEGVAQEPGKSLYRAPALEKGLDILELLATEQDPLTLSAIVQKLRRSTGELFRMIQVLERRDFVEQGEDGYTLTTRLFEMGLGRPPVRGLVELALPVMRRMSVETKQSCHLVLPSRGDMVVVARMESHVQLGFSVRVGYRQPLNVTASGTALYAFQPPEVRREWDELFSPRPNKAELAAFRADADAVREQGFVCVPSSFTEGITDLSAPVMRGDRATAALTVPFVRTKIAPMSVDEVLLHVRAAAAEISQALSVGDNRV